MFFYFIFSGCSSKRPRLEDDVGSNSAPNSPSREDLKPDLKPLSLKINSTTPTTPIANHSPTTASLPAADSTHDSAPSDDENRPNKVPRCAEEDEEELDGALSTVEPNSEVSPSPSTPVRGNRSDSPSPGMDTLQRLFPGKKSQILESVLLKSGGDVLRAIQTLLYTPPQSTSSTPPLLIPNSQHLSLPHEPNNNNNTSPNSVTPEHNPHSNSNGNTNNRTPPPSDLRHHELLQEQAALRASAFAPLGPPGLARFGYPHPQAFMGLPYPPFLHPRPDYYSPLNLASHSPALHHTPPSPIREHSLSPTSPPDHEGE